MIAFDSISASSPEEELKKDLTESTMMIQSKLLAKFFRRNIFDIIYNKIAAVFIGQVRDKVGAYIPTVEPTGGRAIKHFTSVEISLQAQVGKDDLITQDDIPIGAYTKFTIRKNKLAPPFRSYMIPILFGKGIDRLRDFVQFAEYLGVLQKKGPYYAFQGETIGQGLAKTMVILAEKKELLDSIKKTCYNRVNKNNEVKETQDGKTDSNTESL
jgi:recombination protein RecA